MTAARQPLAPHTYFFAGGGTAGHVNPALQVAFALQELEPQAQILFLVTADGLEKALVQKAGFTGLEVEAAPLRSWREFPTFMKRNISGIYQTRKYLKRYQVSVVFGTGGYVSVPLIMAAKTCGVPAYLHEQNALPGRSNRHLLNFSEGIFLSFPTSEKYFSHKRNKKIHTSGNPIHEDFYLQDRHGARQKLGIPPEAELVVCVGGSLGAKSLNQAVEGLPELPQWASFCQKHPTLRIVLSSGKVNTRFIRGVTADIPQIHIAEYIDTKLWFPAADLLVGRSSGGFLAESAASGKASILIPFPQAADDHQTHNAEFFVQHGASMLIADQDLNAQSLLHHISCCLEDSTRLVAMASAAKSLAQEHAAEIIARTLKNLAHSQTTDTE